jgi:hypothetical protein
MALLKLPARGRDTIEPTGPVKVLDGPRSADAADHPSQDGPEIPIQHFAIDRFKRFDDGADLKPARKRLTTTTDKNKGISSARWRTDKAGLGQALMLEIESVHEELSEFPVMAKAVLCEPEF